MALSRGGVQCRECPVFYPSEEEFSDFEGFVAQCEKKALEFGIFKVVPPASWKPRERPYEDSDETVLVAPVRQEAIGHSGMYSMVNVTQKALSVKAFKELAMKPENQPPAPTWDSVGDEAMWDLDRRYWQAFAGARPAVYGADNHSPSLMEDCAGAWNISKLDNLLWSRLNRSGVLPGVNSPYLYLGMWRASFAWHVEDMDLYSINFLHWGAEKVWYCANSKDAERLERFGASLFPQEGNQCPQFLRHKQHVISPSRVVGAGIPLTRVVQRAGEFVISLPYAYHSGFNLGLNCAEAVNFGLAGWVPFGLRCKPCKCFPDAVRIHMSLFAQEGGGEALTEREQCYPEQTIDDILCEACGQDHSAASTLICEACTAGYHMACLDPPLLKKPIGCWHCPACRTEKAKERAAIADKELRNRKCCLCASKGLGGADLTHSLLSAAWESGGAFLGPCPPGKFSVCKKCSIRHKKRIKAPPPAGTKKCSIRHKKRLQAPPPPGAKVCCVCLDPSVASGGDVHSCESCLITS
ncbi:JmjC domain, hydroxylase-domain-containing protein [Baffinella frigidus]|nr:JmjC domain, hydroxylase-domain-containing protein [Cryptophyta sp. CCMP2293]